MNKQTNIWKQHKWNNPFRKISPLFLTGGAFLLLILTLATSIVLAQSSPVTLDGSDSLELLCEGRSLRVNRLSRTHAQLTCIPGENDVLPTQTPAPTAEPEPTVEPEPELVENAYYVAPDGHDNNPGNAERPFRTIQKAANVVRAGDTVYVRAGVYVETVRIRNSGTAEAPITIAAYPGERPVIDGQYQLPSVLSTGWAGCNNTVSPPLCFHYRPLVRIDADYVVFEGFEITRSLGRGLSIAKNGGHATGIIIRNNVIHSLRGAGVNAQDVRDFLFEGNEVYHSSNFATHDRSGRELGWPVAVVALRSSDIVYRGNKIHSNWGEGLSTGHGSINVVIEDNEIYDNYALQVYIHRAHDVTMERNLVYCTNHPDFLRGGNPPPGIIVNNETQFSEHLVVSDVRVVNNIVAGCRQNFAIWGAGGHGARHLLFAHNTLVNATSNPSGNSEAVALAIGNGSYENVRIENNIIYQPYHRVASGGNDPQITFAHNLWLRPPPAHMSHPHDIIGNPQLVNADAMLLPGLVNADWYRLQPGSPAINQGKASDEVTEDFFRQARGLPPDIGSHEWRQP